MSIGHTANHIDPSAAQTVVLLPRINIAAFADNDQTLAVFNSVAKDRRAARTHFSAHAGGIPAACRAYQSEPTPNVLIVETHGQREQVLMELSSLAEVCQPDTKVIVLGHTNDIILYRELIRQGISDYVVAPISPVALLESIAAVYTDPKAKPLGRVISFIGTKGGVGSSTIAHNVAWHFSQKQSIETVITDLDLAYGTTGLNFDMRDMAGAGILEVLSQPDRIDATLIDRVMNKLGDKLNLLASPGGVERDVNVEAQAVQSIINTLRSSSPMIVLDVPYLWSPWIKYTLLSSDEIIITATPELPSLRNAKSLIEHLKQIRHNDRQPRLIINQVGIPKRPEIKPAEFAQALGIEPMAVIPHDPQSFGTAQGNGKMLVEIAPKAKASEIMTQIAAELTGTKGLQDTKQSGSLLAKLPFLNRKKQG
jgi:pilus assembly protein CpaE